MRTSKIAVLGAPDFSIEVVRFTDNRYPRTLERKSTEQVLDTYDPETLLNGITTRMPAMYEVRLAGRARLPRHYKLEFEVRRLETDILRGTFLSGGFGRYAIHYEVEVLARRPDSTVILRKGYRFIDTKSRKTFNGRSPSLEQDQAMLVQMVEIAVQRTSELVAQDIARADSNWRPELEAAPVPTQRIQLMQHPTLNRATGSQSGYDSELILPQTYAPDSVPLQTLPGGDADAPVDDKPVTWQPDRS